MMRLRLHLLPVLALCFLLCGGELHLFAQTPNGAGLEALNDRITALQQAGKYSDALPLAEQYTSDTRMRFGENSPQYAAALNTQAVLLQALNRFAEAEVLIRRAIEIDGKSGDPDNPDSAIRLNILALLLQNTNRFAEAEPLMRRALQISEGAFGPDHENVAVILSSLALLLQSTGRFTEAEPPMRRALAIFEKSYGPDHPFVAVFLNNLTQLLQSTNRFSEAEPLVRRSLQINEKSYGPDHPNVAASLSGLAQLLQATNRLSEAEPLMRRALQINENSFGPSHSSVAASLKDLAGFLQAMNQLAEAEPLMRRALEINEKIYGPNQPGVAASLNNLAGLLQITNRPAEAEPLMRRALEIDEKSLGPNHPNVAADLMGLALHLQVMNRFAEAERLMRRALEINEKAYGPDHPNVAFPLTGLAAFLQRAARLAEAEPLLRRALEINEKAFGPDHPNVAVSLLGLAELLQLANRFTDAEPLIRRALPIFEKSYGPASLLTGITLNNLAQLLQSTNRLAEAELSMQRVISILEKALGSDHPLAATALNNLAALKEEQGEWSAATALYARSKPIMINMRGANAPERSAAGRAVLVENSGNLRSYARALYRAAPENAAGRAEGFELAQWALQNEAADALFSMALRFAKGESRLGTLVREEQDLRVARQNGYRGLDQAAGNADEGAADAARAAISELDAKLAAVTSLLRKEFPDYAELTSPKPLSITEVQGLLGEKQALVLFLDLSSYGKVPEETVVFAVTKNEARWLLLPFGTRALGERVKALRCGLDKSNWSLVQKDREVCKGLLGVEVSERDVPPFDAAAAHALYRDLFGAIEDLIKDRALLIVSSGALAQLPLEVLVTAKPDKTLPRFEAYKSAKWLGSRQPVTVLPSVASLRALRTARVSSAENPFIGFGNPLLTGLNGRDKRAWARQSCPKSMRPGEAHMADAGVAASIYRGTQVDVEELRRQPPLPEAADELCEIAHALGIAEQLRDRAVYLGARATVSQVKTLSQSGDLARARILYFATHGLVASETVLFAKSTPEPALLLTPPDKATAEDNGLLTASEVAQLKLDADWVVMSACNTAAGAGENAEALSGLARAFFYAGARSLLVSHWYVKSKAAVAITTGIANAIKTEPKISRAEALRRSISALIAAGKIKGWNHPSVWAPFVLVGNGET